METRSLVTRAGEVGEMGRIWLKCIKLQLCRMNKPTDLMHTVLDIGTMLRKKISGALI